MLSYRLKCRKNKENKNPRMSKTDKRRLILSSKCVVCDNKKSRFIKKQGASRLSSNLRLKTPLSKIPLLVDILI